MLERYLHAIVPGCQDDILLEEIIHCEVGCEIAPRHDDDKPGFRQKSSPGLLGQKPAVLPRDYPAWTSL